MTWFGFMAILVSSSCTRLLSLAFEDPVLVRDEATAISAVRGPAKRAVKRGSMAVLKRTVSGFLPIGTLNREYYESYGVSRSACGWFRTQLTMSTSRACVSRL